MLQIERVLSLNKIDFWCEIRIAIPIWENVDISFGQKHTLTSRLGGEGVKI